MEESSSLPAALSPIGIQVAERSSYGQAREASIRAAVSVRKDSNQVQRAVTRLDTLLDGDQKPRANVPRGYYINIRV